MTTRQAPAAATCAAAATVTAWPPTGAESCSPLSAITNLQLTPRGGDRRRPTAVRGRPLSESELRLRPTPGLSSPHHQPAAAAAAVGGPALHKADSPFSPHPTGSHGRQQASSGGSSSNASSNNSGGRRSNNSGGSRSSRRMSGSSSQVVRQIVFPAQVGDSPPRFLRDRYRGAAAAGPPQAPPRSPSTSPPAGQPQAALPSPVAQRSAHDSSVELPDGAPRLLLAPHSSGPQDPAPQPTSLLRRWGNYLLAHASQSMALDALAAAAKAVGQSREERRKLARLQELYKGLPAVVTAEIVEQKQKAARAEARAAAAEEKLVVLERNFALQPNAFQPQQAAQQQQQLPVQQQQQQPSSPSLSPSPGQGSAVPRTPSSAAEEGEEDEVGAEAAASGRGDATGEGAAAAAPWFVAGRRLSDAVTATVVHLQDRAADLQSQLAAEVAARQASNAEVARLGEECTARDAEVKALHDELVTARTQGTAQAVASVQAMAPAVASVQPTSPAASSVQATALAVASVQPTAQAVASVQPTAPAVASVQPTAPTAEPLDFPAAEVEEDEEDTCAARTALLLLLRLCATTDVLMEAVLLTIAVAILYGWWWWWCWCSYMS